MHRARFNRNGTFEGVKPRRSLEERFNDGAPVDRPVDGCWEWRGNRNAAGYGLLFSPAGSSAHRYSYERFIGPIPDGLHVRHTCDNPPCCNPAHLLVGTHQDNVDDKMSRDRQPRGTKHARAKLREDQVREIRRLSALGYSRCELGRMFGVAPGAIHAVATYQTWRHVRDNEEAAS
jgi:hypothetical protein